jgi:hypothetical protein
MPFISALIGANAADDAAKAQTNAANQSAQVAKDIYSSQRQDFEPYRQAGISGLNQLQTALDSPAPQYTPVNIDTNALRNTPGYQFQMDEGRRAIEGSRAASGLLQSGETGKELLDYGQGLADQTFQNERNYQTGERNTALNQANLLRQNQVNALQSIINTGSGATGSTAQAGSNYATNATNAINNAGEARAAGTLGAANAWQNGISGALKLGSLFI